MKVFLNKRLQEHIKKPYRTGLIQLVIQVIKALTRETFFKVLKGAKIVLFITMASNLF